jgi:hypothetical protein
MECSWVQGWAVSAPIAGPISHELLEMVCYVHQGSIQHTPPALPGYLTRSLRCRYWHPDEARRLAEILSPVQGEHLTRIDVAAKCSSRCE